MHKKIIFCAAWLMAATCCWAQSNNGLIGTWRLVSGKAVINDSTITYASPAYESMKIVTPTHFSVIGKNGSDGTMQNASAGRVKVEAATYTEYLDFSSNKSNLSQAAVFTYHLEGDRWYLKGGSGNMQFDEVWQRVKQ